MVARRDGTRLLSQNSLREGRREKCEFQSQSGRHSKTHNSQQSKHTANSDSNRNHTPSATLSVVLATLVPTLAHESYLDTEV